MDSTVLAPRPTRSNWARVIYNVLHDNGNRALTKENIWALVPSSMHLPHSFKQFTASMASMANHHFIEGRGPRGAKMFRIATAEVHAARQAVMATYRRNAPKKKKVTKKKTRKYTRRAPVVKAVVATNALQGQIEAEIEQISHQIVTLQAKSLKLMAMSKVAGTL